VKEKADEEDDKNSFSYIPQLAREATVVLMMYGSDAFDIPN